MSWHTLLEAARLLLVAVGILCGVVFGGVLLGAGVYFGVETVADIPSFNVLRIIMGTFAALCLSLLGILLLVGAAGPIVLRINARRERRAAR